MNGNAAEQLANALAKICSDHNADNVQCYTMDTATRIADKIVIATVDSARAHHSLTECIRDYLKAHGCLPPHGVPRHDRSGWIAIDCGDVIVHVLRREWRDYYQLDECYQAAE